MRVNSKKIINMLEEMAPQKYAESWDSVGLQIGNEDSAIDKIMVALEVTADVAAEAEEKSVDLIIAHHPLIFSPIKSITENNPLGRILRRLIRADIHVYTAHTNLDIAWGGLNDTLAELMDLEGVEILQPSEALQDAGKPVGLGRIGYLPEMMTLEELAAALKEGLNAQQLRYVGQPNRPIRKVALCTGAGADLIATAHKAGCDVLITGDIKYHQARDAEILKIALIDAGHFETENTAVSAFANWLREHIDDKGYEVSVIESETLENPFTFV